MATIVHTQGELDAALERNDEDIVIDSPRGVWLAIGRSASVRASGSASVRASDSASVEAWDSASVEASDSASVEAWGSASVRAWGSASVEAWDSASVRASGSASVRASDSASVEAWDSASGRAWDSALVRASDSASVEAWGSASVEAWDSASVEAGKYVAVHVHSQHVTVEGGVVIDMSKLDCTDPYVWCDLHGITPIDGFVRVAKYVDPEWRAGHSHTVTTYTPGTVVTADDWQPTPKCGKGLHFGATPTRARLSAWTRWTGARYVLCEVDLSEAIAVGDKLKARSCRVLHEIDDRGREVVR